MAQGDLSGIWKILLTLLFFPFLSEFAKFGWGNPEDTLWLMAGKRVFLLLPILAVILAYWVSVICLLTVILRNKRRQFINNLFVTWWDLCQSIFSFWAGIFKFAFYFTGAVLLAIKTFIFGVWLLIQDIVLVPFRVVKNLGDNIVSGGNPWIAVGVTLGWCVVEAIVFTYVTTPLITDTLANMTGDQLTSSMIRIPLFLFMFFIVLGSYSVLATWSQVLKTKDWVAIAKIGAIEFVVLMLEVVFLYREFVDALVPWFAQHSGGNFDLGITGTLMIAGMAWFAIRAISWFTFAASGTPVLIAIIQGAGVRSSARGENITHFKNSFGLTSGFV
ncbi:MAG: hypothetical protein AABZ55_14865, partial [Bdellovibrionota bacterium]